MIFVNLEIESPFFMEIMDDISSKKKRVCELTYRLLKAICEKNTHNKNYLFKYLPIFQMQADYLPSAIDCVNMILKDNEELLLTLHKFNQYTDLTNGNSQSKKSFLYSDLSGKLKNFMGASVAKTPQTQIQVEEKAYLESYHQYYDKIIHNFNGGLTEIFENWNPIQFFACLLLKTDDINKQKRLLSFFHTISVNNGQGININQELTFKYFCHNDPEKGSILNSNLIKLFSKDQKKLFVTAPLKPYNGATYELKKFLDNEEEFDGFANFLENIYRENDESFDEENPYHMFRSIENVNEEVLISYIDLCGALCQSRNFSWKSRLEREIPWEALLTYLREELSNEVKASISRLMTSLYIDQEPRRKVNIPVLCKVVNKDKSGKIIINVFLIN